jgi:hypothetical protein
MEGPSRWPRGTLRPKKLALTSPTIVDRSVGIVSSRTQATEFIYYILIYICSGAIWSMTDVTKDFRICY